MNLQTDLFGRGVFKQLLDLSDVLGQLEESAGGWDSMLGSPLCLGLFHCKTGWIFSVAWCARGSECSSGGSPGFQEELRAGTQQHAGPKDTGVGEALEQLCRGVGSSWHLLLPAELGVECFPSLQTVVVVVPGNGSAGQMFTG